MGLFSKASAFEEESTEVNIHIEPGNGDADILEETKTDVLVDDIIETVEELEADGVEVSNASDALDELEDKNAQITEILADDPSAVTEPVANMAIESVATILTRLGGGRTAESITRNTGLVISQESYQSAYDRLVITNESIGGTIRNIIQKIKVIFEKIKAYISKLIAKVKIGFVRLTGRLDRLKSRLSKAKDIKDPTIASVDGRRIAKKLLLGIMVVDDKSTSELNAGDINTLIDGFKSNKVSTDITTAANTLIKHAGETASKSVTELKTANFVSSINKNAYDHITANVDEKPDDSMGPIYCAVANGFRFTATHAGVISSNGDVSEMPSVVSYKLVESVFNNIVVKCPTSKSDLLTMITGMQSVTKNFDKYVKDVEEKVVTPLLNSLNKLSKISVDDIDGKQESSALEKVKFITKLINIVGTTVATAAISGRTSEILGVLDYIGTSVSAFEDGGKKK